MFNYKLITTLTVITLTVYACGGGGSDDENRPPAEVKVTSAPDLGLLETNSIISSRDGGYSALFAGYSVWLYGDSFLTKNNEDGYNFISNTWSYTANFDTSSGITGFQERVDSLGVPKQFFPLTDEEKTFNDRHLGDNCLEKPCYARWAIWPGAIVVDPVKNWAYIFYEKIYAETGNANFQGVGKSIAVWKNFDDSPERPEFNRVDEHPTLAFTAAVPAFGSAALLVDTILYIYGCDVDFVDKPCRLASVPIDDVLDLNAWQYYAGNDSWSSNINDAKSVFNGNDIMSVFYSSYLDRYLAVYSQPLDTKTMLRTAPTPEGPWSKPVKAFDALPPFENVFGVYDALAHPEFTSDDGQTIYITYSRQTALFTGEVTLVAVEIEKTAVE